MLSWIISNSHWLKNKELVHKSAEFFKDNSVGKIPDSRPFYEHLDHNYCAKYKTKVKNIF